MKLKVDGCAVRFRDLPYGSIFITNPLGNSVVRALKAFVEGEDQEHRKDYLVTLGPFTERDQKRPTAYAADGLQGSWVIDVTATCRFAPSLRPEDVLAELPSQERSVGLAFLAADRILLGAQMYAQGLREPVYVDLCSGEITGRIGPTDAVATMAWQLVTSGEEERSMFTYRREDERAP